MDRLKTQRVWATWRGKGWTPCLWSIRRKDAADHCDPDERVIFVEVRQIHQRKAAKKKGEK